MDPQENKVRFLVLASGGFLGIGETNSFIPVDAISRITPDKVHLDKNGTTWRQRLSMTPTSSRSAIFIRTFTATTATRPTGRQATSTRHTLSRPARTKNCGRDGPCPPPGHHMTGQEIRCRQGDPARNPVKGNDCDGTEKQGRRTDRRSCHGGRPPYRLRRRNSGRRSPGSGTDRRGGDSRRDRHGAIKDPDVAGPPSWPTRSRNSMTTRKDTT